MIWFWTIFMVVWMISGLIVMMRSFDTAGRNLDPMVSLEQYMIAYAIILFFCLLLIFREIG